MVLNVQRDRGSLRVDGAVLRSVRRSRGLTQRDLAAAAGISQPRIYQVETGAKPLMQPDTVASLARALHVDPDLLCGRFEVVAVPA
jgi:transcriptional regulator with XRE-family HTH domain